MNCRQVEDLAPLYVAGALRSTDARALEAHIEGCLLHADSLATLREVAYAPAGAIEAIALPRDLKARIMTAVRDEAAAEEASSRTERHGAAWPRPKLALAGAVAIAVLVLAGLLAWNLAPRSGSHGDSENFAVALQGPGGASGAYYYAEGLEGAIFVDGLAPLPEDRTYQVWATSNGSTINCGLLAVAQMGTAFARMTYEMPRDARIFVTVEPFGGSAQPTGATVLSNR
jgi:anti-sigma-K factor RskA